MSGGLCKGELVYGYDFDPYYKCVECGYVERGAPPFGDEAEYEAWREHSPPTHSDYDEEERELGLEDCRCEPHPDEGNCVVCGLRVKYMSHIHFKGQLFHDWCLMIAALKQCRTSADSVLSGATNIK